MFLPRLLHIIHYLFKDYVPDGLSDLAEALANPIKYQSEREKREQQLSVLTDDMETEGSEDQLGSVPGIVIIPVIGTA